VAPERLQKIIARAGVCSRRDAEELIRDGRVTVNGRVAELGESADSAKDAIKVDGKRLKAEQAKRYLLLYKPEGVVTTTDDPEKRRTVIDLLGNKVSEKVFPVGRLDYHSEGLVILTNDGDFALRVAHPRYGVLREYLAKVKGTPDERDVVALRKGTQIEGQHVAPLDVEFVKVTPSGMNSWWKIVLGEGKTHEVRELFKRVGHPVQRLIRVAIGSVRDEVLRPGMWRELDHREIVSLLTVGRGQGRRSHAGTTGAGVHPQAGRLRAGQADRGGPAGAGSERHRQAGLQRKPARDVPQGARRHPEGDGDRAPLPGRRRVRAAQGDRRPPRR
jgi:23S rRNA pseudouridine2605 synthase